MKVMTFLFFFLFLNLAKLEAHMWHHSSPIQQEWKEENLRPFNELILSWNGQRPSSGAFHFYVSVKTEEWSPWLRYASWESDRQSSYSTNIQEASVKVYQDVLQVTGDKKATAFRVQIKVEGEASLDAIHSLHVYTNSDKADKFQDLQKPISSISLKIPGLSQMVLKHERHVDLCSPTSTTAVVRYLAQNVGIDPVDFAEKVRDQKFDIFGNWVLNVAQASTKLGRGWDCWVERLDSFDRIYSHLDKGNPVIVSVRGPLPGSAQPYACGHLMVVVGYDSDRQKILCMDPAFPSDSQTHVSYDLSDFLQAWSRRGNIAYIFSPRKPKVETNGKRHQITS